LNPTVKKALKSLLFLGIGVGLVYLSVKDITARDIDSIKANPPRYTWLLLSMLVGMCSHWIRAVRWRMLIEPVAEKPKMSNSFFAVMIGYMANYAPVLRLGEVYRCIILSRYEKAPVVALVGTVVVERIIDTFLLFILFLVMLLCRFQKVYDVVKPRIGQYVHDKLSFLEKHYLLILLAVAIAAIAFVVFVVKGNNKISRLIKKFLKNFSDGIKSVGKLKKPLLFWIYSVIIWVFYLLSTYLCLQCFDVTAAPNLTLADAVVVLIFGTLGIIASPGGIGAFQLIIKNVLEKIYKIAAPIPFALGWIIWGSQFILIVSLGLISLALLPILNKNDKA
jgi:uncharacterized protein (TIRG00374 family)